MAYKPWTTSPGDPPRPLDTPVLVDLDRLYPPHSSTETDAHAGAAPPAAQEAAAPLPHRVLHLAGRVPGTLRWWKRATDGRWYGQVTFPVYDAYGATMHTNRDVLIPADALSPIPAELLR